MDKQILIFSLNGCGHCKILKEKLNESSIPFTDLEINSNRKIWDQVVKQTGLNILPTVVLKTKGTDDGLVFVPSRDFKNVEEIVEKIKNLL
jgi:glutaredoxin